MGERKLSDPSYSHCFCSPFVIPEEEPKADNLQSFGMHYSVCGRRRRGDQTHPNELVMKKGKEKQILGRSASTSRDFSFLSELAIETWKVMKMPHLAD